MTKDDSPLAERHCTPCKEGTPPLEGDRVATLLGRLEGWEAVDEHHLTKTFRFKDFRGALEFVNRVGKIADDEGHHPDVHLAWGRATIEIWTHSIDGLSESDFVLAAKIDEID